MITESQEEIEILCEGGKRLAEIISKLKKAVVPGITGEELEDMARRLVEEGGDEAAFLGYTPSGAKRPYPAALCLSVNEEVVHGIPNEEPKVISEGDIVSLDAGLVHKGLITDMAVTILVGKGDEETEKLIDATKKCLDAGIRAVRAGATTGDIGAAILRESENYNFGLVKDLGGHGVGRKVHESPHVPNFGRPGAGEMLVEGQVIAIEPQLTLGKGKVKLMPDGYTFVTKDGSRAAHFEHTVLVTKNGCEVLTKV